MRQTIRVNALRITTMASCDKAFEQRNYTL